MADQSQTTLTLSGIRYGYNLPQFLPVEASWTADELTIEFEATLPAAEYNVEGSVDCVLPRTEAERLRDWLIEILA